MWTLQTHWFLDALGSASHFDNSNMKLQCMWYECITQLFAKEHGAKQSSLTESELLLRLKDAVVEAVQCQDLGRK